MLRGDLGQSLFWNQSVAELIRQRMEPTLSLTITTLILAVSIAITLGVLAAWKAGSLLDRTVMGVAVTGFSVPVFVVGYLLVFVFAILAARGAAGVLELARRPLRPRGREKGYATA